MTAAALDQLVLPSDVVIAPVAELPPELRDQFEHRTGDYSVTRPRARTMSSIVDGQTAALLDRFREPTTIVDAVIAFSRAEGLDPRETLDDAFAVLGGFVNEGLLVAAGSELAEPIATTLVPGDSVGGFEVVAPVHVLVDTEVYIAHASDGSPAALKIARAGAGNGMHAALRHEAAVLEALDGRVSPRLLELGAVDDRPFLATSWCLGIDVFQAAGDARSLDGSDGRTELLALAQSVVAAYAHLHAQGVLHGDVHPRNVLVDGDGGVALIDFGLAAGPPGSAAPAAGWRGGIDFFMEPELAAARLDGRPSAALSAEGEQYSVGSLLYLLLTGAHTREFSLEQEEMLHQLLEQPPVPFRDRGVHDLHAVERVLARALDREPGARFPTMLDFSEALRGAAASDLDGGERAASTPHGPDHAQRLLDEVLERLAVPGELFAGGLAAPTASAMNGGAGFAYALLRIARARGDESLLALADLWSTRSVRAVESPDAFWSEELEIVPEVFGRNSFYHTAAGVHCVHALVAHGRGDERAQQLALSPFVAATGQPCEHVDVAFGLAGHLLGCSLLIEAPLRAAEEDALRSLGEGLRDRLWARLDRQPRLAESTELRLLGAAHGWAGYLYALLRWSDAAGAPPPDGLRNRLDELGALGQPAGRGLRWPHEIGAPLPDTALAASWCNGAAGFVPLWIAAHRTFGDETYARWAEMAAWSAYEGPPAPGDLCCGFAGRAYALMALHREAGDRHWLARARSLADRAVTSVRADSMRRDSLYKGEVGVALLAADLETPEYACMPMFEAEGWPR
ncbi:MAG TPA: lanthionine synthetase LanC family protein [Thermoleophilaceae bacterium]